MAASERRTSADRATRRAGSEPALGRESGPKPGGTRPTEPRDRDLPPARRASREPFSGPSPEVAARTAWERRDYGRATTIVLEAYGDELYGFLLAQLGRDTGRADDVFSEFAEDFWRSLPSFEWRCSARAWCYKLVRSATARHWRSPHNRAERQVPLSAARSVDEVMIRARTSTRPHLRTDMKDKIQELRAKLAPEDRDLLILRVDRGLSWSEVSFAMLAPDDVADEALLEKREVSLRQRFAEIKKRLRRLAAEAGLL